MDCAIFGSEIPLQEVCGGGCHCGRLSHGWEWAGGRSLSGLEERLQAAWRIGSGVWIAFEGKGKDLGLWSEIPLSGVDERIA